MSLSLGTELVDYQNFLFVINPLNPIKSSFAKKIKRCYFLQTSCFENTP